MKINGLWAHNGLSDKGYAYAEALTENEKRAKPFLDAIVFLILGVSILVNTIYFGEIKGYKVTIDEMQGKGRSGVTYYVSYILEVHLDTGRTKRTDETIEVQQKGVEVGGIYR